MKKAFLLLFYCVFYAPSLIAQQKENNDKTASTNKIGTAAKKWFKNTYLKSKHPDARAWKVLAWKVTPVSIQQQIKLEIDKATQGISAYDTLAAGSNYSHYLHLSEKDKITYEKIVSESGAASPVALEKKKEIDQFLEKMADTKQRLKEAIKDEVFWNQQLKKMPREQANLIAYYNVFLNGFWKNALTEKISGTFYFNFDDKGIVGDVSENTF
ncbi:MAG: hypothetical protein ACOH2A_13165 [Sphingobacteriaceae bacterium]